MRLSTLIEMTDFWAACRRITAVFALLLFSAIPALAAISVNPTSVPAGTLGQFYDNTFTASGGTAPYTFAVTSGALPPGLSLDGVSGELMGTPSSQGVFNFTITATDSLAATGARAYAMSVGTFSLAVQPNTLPSTTLGMAYNQTLTAVGGNPPYTFTVSSGALPTGVSLATDGTISGTTTAGGSFTFIVRADDNVGNTGFRTYTVNVGTNALTIAPPTLPDGTQGSAYNQTVTASGGVGAPYTYSVSSGALPAGLSLNTSTGQISGTPSAGGAYSFTIRAVDSNNNFGTQSYTVNIGGNSLILSPSTLPNGTVSTAYSQTVTASSGTGGPYTYSLGSGSLPLPPGLSLNGTTGAITGTPSSAGSFNFTIHAVDGSNNFGDQSYTIIIGTNSLTVSPFTIANGMVGTGYSQTISASGGTAPYSFAVSSGTLPNGLSLNSANGVISGTPSFAGSFSFTITATDAAFNTGSVAYTVTIAAAALTLAPSTLPNGTQGVAYTQAITATGGAAPYVYALLSGALPTGLSLNTNTGDITGTPTMVGNYSFTIQATDNVGAIGSQTYTVSIGTSSLTLTPSTLPNGTQGNAYSQTITASGGTGPYTFAIASGALPSGLSLNAATGAITGTLSGSGVSNFTIQATDSIGNIGSNAYTVSVGTTTLTISPSTLPDGTQGAPYSQTITASGGTAPYIYSVLSGALPTGLSLNSATGAITGTPTVSGVSNFTIQVMDSIGNVGSSAYTVTIATVTLTINPVLSPTTLPDGTLGIAYNQTVTASGGTGPYTYAVLSGALPTGLSLNSASGAITGTPTVSGVSNFTIQVTDSVSNVGSNAYTVTIASASLTLNPTTLQDGLQGTAYSQTVSASGGTGPYTFTVSSGAFPDGLLLNGASGAIMGTPTGSGVSSFTIQATDSLGNVGSTAYTINIVSSDVTINPATLPNTVQATPYSQTVTVSGGTGPYTLSLASGALPDGIVFDASAGTITGTPTGYGSSTFTISATDANGNTGARTYTLSTAHADPGNNVEVQGLVAAQSATVRRLTGTQSTNVQRRLEILHGNSNPCGLRMGITASANNAESAAPVDSAYGTGFPPGYNDPYAGPIPPPAAAPSSDCSLFAGQPVSVWANGALEFGRMNSAGSASSDFSTSGLTAGIDTRFGDRFVVGAAVGYGLDNTDIGTRGTASEADNFSGMVYSSFELMDSVFLDTVVGHGLFSFDNSRFVDIGNTVKGSRDGSATFGSTTFSAETQEGDLKLATYLQFDAMTAKLNAYSENGNPGETLSYDDASFSSLAGAVGLRGSVDFTRGSRTFTPHVRVEYKRAFDSSFSQSLYYNDTGPGTVYAVNQADAARDIFTGVIGMRTTLGSAATFDFEYGASGEPSSETNSISQTVRTAVHWNLR